MPYRFVLLAFLLSLLLFLSPSFEGLLQAVFLFFIWALGLWALLSKSGGEIVQPAFPLFWPFLAFVTAGLLATAAAANTAAGVNWISKETGLMVLLILAYQWARDSRIVLTGLKLLIIAAGLLAAYGLFQSLVGLPWTAQDLNHPPFNQQPMTEMIKSLALTRRAFSLFAYPNLFGGFLAVLLPLNLALFYPGLVNKKWPWMLTLVFIVLGLLASGSFGAWAAAFLGVGLLLVWLPLKRRLKFFLALLMTAVGLAGLIWLLGQRPFHDLITSWQGRVAYWRMTLAMVKGHWLLGVGPGNFSQAFAQAAGDKVQPLRFAHQFLLQQLAEKGVLGLGAILWILGAAGTYLVNLRLKLSEGPAAIVVAAVGAGLAAGLVHASIDLDADYLKTSLMLWFFGGVLLSQAEQLARQPDGFEAGLKFTLPPRLLIGVMMMTMLSLLLWKGGKSLWVEAGVIMLSLGLAALLLGLYRQHREVALQLWHKMPLKTGWGLLLLWTLFSVAHAQDKWQAATTLWVVLGGLLTMGLTIQFKVLGVLVMRFLTLAPVVLAAFCIIQLLIHPLLRADGGWPNPNLTAAFLAAGLIINLSLALTASKKTWRFAKSWLSTLILFSGLIATGSMAGWLNFLTGMIVIGAWAAKQKVIHNKTIVAALLVAMALMLVIPLGTGKRILGLPHYRVQLQERLGLMQATGKMIKAHPWLGIGPAQFNQTFDRYSFPNPQGQVRYGRQANFSHQELLQVAAVLGLPGLIIIMFLLVMFVRRFFNQWQQDKSDGEQLQLMLVWAVLGGALIQAQMDFNWHLPLLFFIYMMLAGMVWTQREETVFPAVAIKPSAAGLLGVLILAMTIGAAVRPALGAYFTHLGDAHYYKKHLKTAGFYLEQALSLTPLSALAYDKLGLVRHDLYAIRRDEKLFYPAQWAFSKALAFNPGRAATYRHLGRLYWQRGGQDGEEQWFEAGLAAYSRAAGLDPHNAVLFFEWGNLWRDAGHLQQAKAAWLKALALQPYYAAAASNLGVACELLHQDQQAEQAYRQALGALRYRDKLQGKLALEFFSMDWAVVYYNLAALLERQGRFQEAKKEYQAALVLEPQNSMARDGLERLSMGAKR